MVPLPSSGPNEASVLVPDDDSSDSEILAEPLPGPSPPDEATIIPAVDAAEQKYDFDNKPLKVGHEMVGEGCSNNWCNLCKEECSEKFAKQCTDGCHENFTGNCSRCKLFTIFTALILLGIGVVLLPMFTILASFVDSSSCSCDFMHFKKNESLREDARCCERICGCVRVCMVICFILCTPTPLSQEPNWITTMKGGSSFIFPLASHQQNSFLSTRLNVKFSYIL